MQNFVLLLFFSWVQLLKLWVSIKWQNLLRRNQKVKHKLENVKKIVGFGFLLLQCGANRVKEEQVFEVWTKQQIETLPTPLSFLPTNQNGWPNNLAFLHYNDL